MEIWYLKLGARERKLFCIDEPVLRQIVCKLTEIAGRDMALFAVTLRAVHLVVVGTAQRAGRISAGIVLAVRPLVGVEFAPTYKRLLEGRAHLRWYVDHLLVDYLQEEGVEAHPALWSGSCFQELIGARSVDGLNLQLGAVLPNYRTRYAYSAVGLEREKPLSPLSPEWIRVAGAARVVAAVAASLCVDPPRAQPAEVVKPALPGNTPRMIRARRAAVTLARIAGLAVSDVAGALGVSDQAVRRLAGRSPDWTLVNAAATRLALEDELRRVTLGVPRYSR